MVAGNHADRDARSLAGCNGFRDSAAQRVDHAGKPQKTELAGFGGSNRVIVSGRRLIFRQSQNAQTLGGQPPGGLHRRLHRPGTHRQHPLRSALDQHAHAPAGSVVGGRKLPLRLVGNLVDLGVLLEQGRPDHAQLHPQRQQRQVGRIPAPDPGAIAQTQVPFVAQHRGADQGGKRGGLRTCQRLPPQQNVAIRRKALTGYSKPLARGQHDLTDRELVLRKGAGFVARNQGATTKTLHRGKPPDDYAALRHPRRRHRQRHRERRRQPLGDRRHGQRDPKKQHLLNAEAPAEHPDRANEERGAENDNRHRVAESFHADQQGSLAAGGADDVERNLANCSRGARGHRDAAPAAPDNGRAGVGHVAPVSHRGAGIIGPPHILAHRQRFAGQQRLVNLQAGRGKQPDISRHPVAGFEPDNIAGHHLSRVNLLHLPIAEHRGANPQQLLQGSRTLLGPPLLIAANSGVDRQHHRDEGGIGDIAGEDRQSSRQQQDVDQRTEKLPEQNVPNAGHRLARQFVRSAGPLPFGGLSP